MVERTIKFKDDKIYNLVNEKAVLLEEARNITLEIEKLEHKRAKLGLSIQKMKNKIIPMIAKRIKNELEDFEYATKSDVDGEEIVVNVVDAVEEFKRQYKKENK